MKCRNCGCDNKDGVNFCRNCGQELVDIPMPNYGGQTPSNKDSSKKNTVLIVAVVTAIIVVLILASLVVGSVFFIKNEISGDADTNETTVVTEAWEVDSDYVDDDSDGSALENLRDVPDVMGLRQDDATKKLTQSGFTYSITTVSSDTVSTGYVVSQSPIGGKTANQGSNVVIYVAKNSSSDTDNTVTLYCRASEFATLRDIPDRSGKSLTKIGTRESVTYLGVNGEFYYVQYRGMKGYVLKDFFSTDYNAPLNYGKGNKE